MTEQNWWTTFFDSDFSDFLLDRENDPALVPTADFLIASFGLKPGDTIYDQCCGTGAVSRALAHKGIRVVGVDQAEHYIARAKALSAKEGLTNTFFETGDAFEYTSTEPCEAAINWYTSFGYTDDDAQNIKMLQRIREGLKPGGHIGIEYMNVLNILANFKPVWIREAEVQGQSVQIEKHTTLDQNRGMIGSRWVYKFPNGQEREANGESRLYKPEDFETLLEEAGFEDIQLHGGFNGEPCDENAARCVALGRLPS